MISRWLVVGLAVGLGLVALSAWPDISPKLQPLRGAESNASGYHHGHVAFASQSISVLIPVTKATQEKGLGGRENLSDHEGMLWRYASSVNPTFWMHGMLIPLDFIWLEKGIVVEVTENVPPPQTANADPAIVHPSEYVDGVLEVPAGFVERHGVAIGSIAEITEN